MTLDMVIKSRETIKGKICTLKNIEEFSIFTQENEDRRDYSLKYKLILTILICLFELSNQYFFYSAKWISLDSPSTQIWRFLYLGNILRDTRS